MGRKKILLKVFAIICGFIGIVVLLGVFLPIIYYQNFSNQNFPTLISPEVEKSEGKVDYTKASNWFQGGANKEAFLFPQVSFYTMSIPKLKIKDASVAIGGEDLSKSLIQYPGTSFPGKIGNSVIFGHSILPIFFDPKNYMSIFSTLPSMRKGDEITINYDGILYKYRVETLFEISPTDLQILDQDSSDSFLTLVTCVPPGDPRRPKRLIVRARIVPPEEVNANTRD
jgi:sortase A